MSNISGHSSDSSEDRINEFVNQVLRKTEKDNSTSFEFSQVENIDSAEIISRLNSAFQKSKPKIEYNACSEILTVTMPSKIHNAFHSWIMKTILYWDRTQQLLPSEEDALFYEPDSVFHNFLGVYQNSTKQPDFCIWPRSLLHPTVVVESGYSQSRRSLRDTAQLWLYGTRDVHLVILFKWTQLTNRRVKCICELWRRGLEDITCEILNIFPNNPNQFDAFFIKKSELIGLSNVVSNPDNLVYFSITHLQRIAAAKLEMIGLTPAED